jgi:dTDP-4-dehydrorhamnose reductase
MLARVAATEVLVLGGSGLVGSGVQRRWAGRSVLVAPSHAQLDVLDARAVETFLHQSHAEVVLNLAAWADVDGAEPEKGDFGGRVYQLNVSHPQRLAQLCGELRKHLVHISTDYVFDGTRAERPYVEDDATNPLGWYAETKRLGEQAILESGTPACIARIEMPFTGAEHVSKLDFARLCAGRLAAGQAIQGVTDQRVTPVFLDDAVDALWRLIEARYKGIVHVAAASWTTPYEFARAIAQRLHLDQGLVQAEPFERFAPRRPARRPQHPWLDVASFTRAFGQGILRSVDEELDAWAAQLTQTPTRAS